MGNIDKSKTRVYDLGYNQQEIMSLQLSFGKVQNQESSGLNK